MINTIYQITSDDLKQVIREVLTEVMEASKPEKVESGFITRKELASRLKMSPATITRYIEDGKIPFSKFGRKMLFDVAVVDQIVRSGAVRRYGRN